MAGPRARACVRACARHGYKLRYELAALQPHFSSLYCKILKLREAALFRNRDPDPIRKPGFGDASLDVADKICRCPSRHLWQVRRVRARAIDTATLQAKTDKLGHLPFQPKGKAFLFRMVESPQALARTALPYDQLLLTPI